MNMDFTETAGIHHEDTKARRITKNRYSDWVFALITGS